MKHIALIFAMFMTIAMTGCSANREMTTEELLMHDTAVSRLKEQQFTLKSDRLVLDKRNFPAVSPSYNFIQVDNDRAIVQVNPGNGGGPNGIGGFTVKGSVSGYEVKAKDNGGVSVRFNVTAAAGSCTVFINLPKNGTQASVSINNMLRGHNATIYGDIDSVEASVVVGRSLTSVL